MTADTSRHEGRGTITEVMVAACSGSAKLSRLIGLPIVHIDAVRNAEVAVKRLNQIEYASGVRVPHLFQPIGFDAGWTDWGLFPYAPGPWRRSIGARPDGVSVVDGRLKIYLPQDVTREEFREELEASLRHLRLHEVTS